MKLPALVHRLLGDRQCKTCLTWQPPRQTTGGECWQCWDVRCWRVIHDVLDQRGPVEAARVAALLFGLTFLLRK